MRIYFATDMLKGNVYAWKEGDSKACAVRIAMSDWKRLVNTFTMENWLGISVVETGEDVEEIKKGLKA